MAERRKAKNNKAPPPDPDIKQPRDPDIEKMLEALKQVYRDVAAGEIRHITIIATALGGKNYETSLGRSGPLMVPLEHVIGHLQIMLTRITIAAVVGRKNATEAAKAEAAAEGTEGSA